MPSKETAAAKQPGGNERVSPPATWSAQEALIKWFEENCRDSDISRDTDVYNAVHGHVHAVKALLNGLSAKPKE